MIGEEDDPITKLTTPAGCEQFAHNVRGRNPALADAAIGKAIRLRAKEYGAETDVELAVVEAVYAYEHALNVGRTRRITASRTWQMIERHGLIEALESIVTKPGESQGYKVLVGMGLKDLLFESVVDRYPDSFTPEAVNKSRERLAALAAARAQEP